MRKTYLYLIATCLSFGMFAQPTPLKTTKDAHKLSESVLQKIVDGQSEEAFNLLQPHWPLDAAQISNLGKTTAEQIPMLEEQFGKLVGYEFANSEQLGTFGYLEQYVLKYEQSALRFYIIYYNSGSGWLVNSLYWDDGWDKLFKSPLKGDN